VGGGEPRLVVKGDTVCYGGAEIIRLTADPSTSPRVIDLKFRDPDRVYEGIYAVEKDTLKVCLNGRADAKDRPGAFSTKDQPGGRLLVFEREKAAPANPAEGATAYAGVQLRADAETRAVVVDTPIKGSPAEKAGLKKGDVILKVGGVGVTDPEATVKAVRQAKPGDKLDFRISRDDKEMVISVTVGVFPFHWAVGLE
jgi:C-terminal processing protease CtpA/Prc